MELRIYKRQDFPLLAELFYNTVHIVNAKDYNKAQLDVWASGNVEEKKWNKAFLENYTVVALINNIVVGFGDMDKKGYLDMLYVHKDFQGGGIGTAIVNELEKNAFSCGNSHFTTHASVTAKPFFEKRGYTALCENKVVRSGIELKNYIMEKTV